jgi:hypothetical protein
MNLTKYIAAPRASNKLQDGVKDLAPFSGDSNESVIHGLRQCSELSVGTGPISPARSRF